MSFPTLFTTSSKVGTRYWKIQVIEEAEGVFLLKEYGKYGGKAIINRKQILVAKSQSTIREQALFEAKGEWDEKKTKKGYVENIDQTNDISSQLGGEAPAPAPAPAKLKFTLKVHTPAVVVVASVPALGKVLERTGRTERTSSSSLKFLPMLANKWAERKSYLKYPCVAQPKLDGVRHSAHLEDGQIVIKTRNDTNCVFFQEIKRAVAQLGLQYGVYLDGEFYSQTIPFRTLNGYCNRKKMEGRTGYQSIPRQHLDSIQYHIFDCYFVDQPQKPFCERYQYLVDLLKNNQNPYLKLVPNYELASDAQVKSQHDQCVAEGYEGLILRNVKAAYKLKDRSNDLLKYKSFLDSEFEIAGATSPETGKEAGCIIWTLKISTTGATFTCRPRDTYVSRQADWAQYQHNPAKFIGQQYTVRYQETYENGIPRFPVGVALRFGDM